MSQLSDSQSGQVGAKVQMPEIRLGGLDGLRGLTMLMVIFTHLNVLSSGWLGLESFFVLSGFLITRILLSDRESSEGLGPYFRRFYIRRLLRVFPIYYAYLLAVLVVAYTVPALARIQGEMPYAFLYVYNFRMIADHEHTKMLGHLWSLSVEEQFYLFWPWLIALVPRRRIPAVCLGLIFVGPLVRQWLHSSLFVGMGAEEHRLAIYTYIFTLSHLDAFAFGALVNFVSWRPSLKIVAWFGAAAIALGLAVNGWFGMNTLSLGWPVFMPNGYQYAWGYTVVGFFWFMVICSILGGGAIYRFFSNAVLDYLGKRSYSTYIVHFPLLALMDPLWKMSIAMAGKWLGTGLFAVPYLAVVFLVAAITYRYIEMPMNTMKDRFRASRKPEGAAA